MIYSAWNNYTNFGSDIGGYRSGPGVFGRTQQLFMRWFQVRRSIGRENHQAALGSCVTGVGGLCFAARSWVRSCRSWRTVATVSIGRGSSTRPARPSLWTTTVCSPTHTMSWVRSLAAVTTVVKRKRSLGAVPFPPVQMAGMRMRWTVAAFMLRVCGSTVPVDDGHPSV